MKEVVIISGKGGTGKTSIAASLAALAENAVVADCDVDAADMHLVLQPKVDVEHEFFSGMVATTDLKKCTSCGKCRELCRFDAFYDDYTIDPVACEGCGVCVEFCPEKAISLDEKMAGRWFESTTDYGPLYFARLNVAEDNSGKLVTRVRDSARTFARDNGKDYIIVDGPPGIGCPVIASVTGANLVVAVTEPTVSGIHDLKRVVDLAGHFTIPVTVCINKYDLSEKGSSELENYCRERDIPVIGKLPFDAVFTDAMVAELPVVRYSDGEMTRRLTEIWEKVKEKLED